LRKILINRKYIIVAIVIGIGGVAAGIIIPSLVNDSDNARTLDFVVFSDVDHTEITRTSVVLVATTSVPVFCEIEFAQFEKDTIFASDSDVNTEPHTKHSIPISDLRHTTQYNYQFQAENNGEMFYSDIRAFFTTR